MANIKMAAINYYSVTLFLPMLVTLLGRTSAYTAYHQSNDRCTIYQGSCAYHIIVTGKDCTMAGDSPIASPYRSPRESGIIDNNHIDPVPVEGEEKSEENEAMPAKKFEELERKLVKMMEGLSIRSLRHIRQIKTNLRRMYKTIDHLDKTAAGKGGKSGKIECPNEFVGVGTWGSCYRFSSFNATWHEAREYCSAFGAELVSLDTMKEAYILDYLIKSNPDYEIPKGWWTSGNYIVRNRKWMWTSIHHLKPIRFSRWAPGEPDARSTMHCMMLYKEDKYQWHDAMCTDRHNFVCEIDQEDVDI